MVALALPTKAEIGILLTDAAEIRRLNRLYRNRDQATNVLSFAMEDGEREDENHPKKAKSCRLLGDIVLAYEVIAREAVERQIPMKHHMTHLVIHGMLHLLGYDHERSPEDARCQENQEIAILASLGLTNPYE